MEIRDLIKIYKPEQSISNLITSDIVALLNFYQRIGHPTFSYSLSCWSLPVIAGLKFFIIEIEKVEILKMSR